MRYLLLILLILLFGCGKKGQVIDKGEGLVGGHKIRVYNYCTGDDNWVKLAFIDDQINSTTYQVGKVSETCIIVNSGNTSRMINGDIVMDNDSLILIKKKKQ